jgi:hypothetical protein
MNAHEALNRTRKARRIFRALWRAMKPADRRSDLTVQLARRAPQTVRDVIARNAGTKVPSEATWSTVVEMLAEAVRDEQEREAEPARVGA